MNLEFPDVQAGFRKGRGTKDQTVNICWITKKTREFQKNICFIDYTKTFDYVDHNKLWTILEEIGIPDPFTCLLRNLYVGKQELVRTGHGITDWFKIVTLLYAEYIMRNARLDEAPAGIKVAGRNINNLRYAEDTTLMAESKEDVKSLLMRVKEENEKVGLKLNIYKN